jgi:UDP-4-amino-4,6-dideoxy-N-acetyl-beta-L-altrosamine transaminase
MIPYGRQHITDEDVAAVVRVLRSDWLTQGPSVPEFESLIAQYCGVAHALAVNSATSALHIACLALGLGPGDWLWTSPITFAASANCGLYCGAQVDFVDIDRATYTMSVQQLEAKLERASREGRLPKVVVPVHMTGQSCDMAAIGDLARKYGFRVIEDASHAIGASWEGARVGACIHSDIAVFSFHPVKIITTGEGGMLLTRDADLARKLEKLRTHGITRRAEELHHHDGPWYYEQLMLGYNYRMTDIQAALGSSQLGRIESNIARRRALARRYDELLQGLPLTLPWQDVRGESAWHLYVVLLNGSDAKSNRRAFFESMRQSGIGVNVHYIPVHLLPYHRAKGFSAGDFPQAEDYYQRATTLPMFHAMTDAEQLQVVEAARKSLTQLGARTP